jgi:hypothetical protein
MKDMLDYYIGQADKLSDQKAILRGTIAAVLSMLENINKKEIRQHLQKAMDDTEGK